MEMCAAPKAVGCERVCWQWDAFSFLISRLTAGEQLVFN